MDTTITIINKHTSVVPPDAVYIGRPSPLGNPFVLGRDGDRAAVIASYRHWLWKQVQAGQQGQDNAAYKELQRLAQLLQQQGVLTLVCWCSPLPCHGDVLAAALRWYMALRQ